MPHSYLILKLELLHKDWIQRLLNQFHYPPLCRQGFIFRLLYSNDHFKTFLTWLRIHSSSLGPRPRNSITSVVAWVGRYRHKKGRIRQKHSSLQTRSTALNNNRCSSRLFLKVCSWRTWIMIEIGLQGRRGKTISKDSLPAPKRSGI